MHVNKATARYLPDGSVLLVAAHADPRVAATSSSGRQRSSKEQGGGATEAAAGSGSGSGPGAGGALAGVAPEAVRCVDWVDTAHHAHGTMGLR